MIASDPIAAAIADRATRSRVARAHVVEIVADLERLAPAEPTPQLRDFLARIATVLAGLESAWRHQPDESFKRYAVTVETLLEAGMGGYQRLAAESGLSSQERSRRSVLALLLGDALCTLRTGVPGVESAPDLSSLHGAANCASTGGGGPASLHRHTNVLEQIAAVNTSTAGLRIRSDALSYVVALRIDPLAAPAGVDGIVAALYAIAQGVAVAT